MFNADGKIEEIFDCDWKDREQFVRDALDTAPGKGLHHTKFPWLKAVCIKKVECLELHNFTSVSRIARFTVEYE